MVVAFDIDGCLIDSYGQVNVNMIDLARVFHSAGFSVVVGKFDLENFVCAVICLGLTFLIAALTIYGIKLFFLMWRPLF